jgi:hypothetical protein
MVRSSRKGSLRFGFEERRIAKPS